MKSLCFYYQNKQYFIDFELFKKHSKYISKLFPEPPNRQIINLNLISGFDISSYHSDESINTFFSYCQDQHIKIADHNAVSLYLLSKLYEIQALNRKTKKYITEHYENIIDNILSKIKDSDGDFALSNLIENIISDHFSEYLTDSRLLYIRSSVLNRILTKYLKQFLISNQYEIQDDEIEIQLIDFLFKYINKNGPTTSYFISMIKFGKKGCLYLNDLLSENSSNFDFEYLKPTIFRCIHFLSNKEEIKNEIREEIRLEYDKRQKSSIDIIRTNCIEIFNEFLQIEVFNDKFIKDKDDEEDNFLALLKYGFLYTIRSIFNGVITPESHIEKEMISLKSGEKLSVSKFDILNGLLQNKLFAFSPSIIVGNKTFSEVISIISLIQSTQQKKYLKQLFKLIERKNSLIEFIVKIFPFQSFKNSDTLSLLSLWIPVVKSLIQNGISLIIQIDDDVFSFNKSQSITTVDLRVYLVMNDTDSLTLCKGSRVKYGKKTFSLTLNNDSLSFHFLNEIAEKKMKTSESVKADKIFEYYLSNANKKLNTKNPLDNKIVSLHDLIDAKSDTPNLISLIWNLVFTLSDIEIFELASIINPVESRMLKSVAKMFQLDSTEVCTNMIQWCNWAQSIDSYIDTINGCIIENDELSDDINLSKIESLITQIDDAMNYLKKATEIKNNFWDSEEILACCQKKFKKLTSLKSKKSEIKKKFVGLIENLNGETINEEFAEIKNDLIDEIDHIHNFTNSTFSKVKSIINEFLTVAKEKVNIDEYNDDDLNWPFDESSLSDMKGQTKSEKIELFNTLIWYLKIESTLKEIESNTNLFSNLNKLSQIPLLKNIQKRILSHLISDESIQNDIKDAINTLQANVIYKLFAINEKFITDPMYITNIINEYSNRKMCSKYEIKWINQIMKENPSNFILRIPKFTPNSLLYLVVGPGDSDDKYSEGRLFEEMPDFNINFVDAKKIGNLHHNFSTFSEAAVYIGQILYTSIISQSEVPPEKFESLRQAFQNISFDEYSILKVRIEILFLIAESLDNWSESKFTFDDMFFLKMDYSELVTNDLILNSYPSFLFWIIENESFMKKLMKMNKKIKMKRSELPLWIVCLRILSSQNCIKFESDSKSRLFEVINSTTTNKILNFLNDDSKSNGYVWLNILRSSLPHSMKISSIQLFHEYLKMLSLDSYESENAKINNIKNQYVNDSVNELTHLLLSNKVQSLFEAKASKSTSIFEFLTKPSKFIQKYIDLVLKLDGENEKIFDFNYNLVDFDKIKNQKISMETHFTSFDDESNLTSPVLFVSDKNEISCSLKKIDIQIGPLFSSLKSIEPIKINLMSFIDKNVTVSIENKKNEKYLKPAKYKFKNKELIEIIISPPKIERNDFELIQIKDKLKFESENVKPLTVPVNFNLLLVPVQVKIKCNQYLLAETANNCFRVCCDHLYSSDQIDFQMDFYHLDDVFIQKVSIELLDGNGITKPFIEIDKEKRTFSIKMPSIDEPHRCNLNALIKLTSDFDVRIHFDLVLRPYFFRFEVYDYCMKKYVSDFGRVLLIKPDLIQFLYFRIVCHKFERKRTVKLLIDLPYSVHIDSTDLKNLNEFEIEGPFNFFFVISNSITKTDLIEKLHSITIEIGDVKQTIKLSFFDTLNDSFYPSIKNKVEMNNDYLSEFPCYTFSSTQKKWTRITSHDDLVNKTPEIPYVTVTPFSSYKDLTEYITVKYDDDTVTTATNSPYVVKYLQISPKSDTVNISTTSKSETKIKYSKKFAGIVSKAVSSSYYSMLGFVEENTSLWFPAFTEYPNIKSKGFLSYSADNIEKAKANLHEIFDSYPSKNANPMRQTSSIVLMYFLTEKSNVYKIESIVNQFPTHVKDELKYALIGIDSVLNKIDKGEFPENMYVVISYNLYLAFICLLENKYNVIRTHSFCLQMNVSDDEIGKKVDSAYCELMSYDDESCNLLNDKTKDLLTNYMNKIERIENVEKLPVVENQFECFMLNVNDSKSVDCGWNDRFYEVPLDFDEFNSKSVLKCVSENCLNLPTIDPPSDCSIDSCMKFFVCCIQASFILPSTVIRSLVDKSDMKNNVDCFNMLLKVFKEVTRLDSNDKSILSGCVNDFIESFLMCARRLKLSGCEFDEIKFIEDDQKLSVLLSIPKYSFE